MPMASLMYSFTIGLGVTMVLLPAQQAASLADTQLLLLLGLAVMHMMFLQGGWHGTPGARTSIELLLQTLYAKWYLGLVMAVGIVLPALVLWLVPSNGAALVVTAVALLSGFMAWRILIFKIGVYEPIMSMNPFNSAG